MRLSAADRHGAEARPGAMAWCQYRRAPRRRRWARRGPRWPCPRSSAGWRMSVRLPWSALSDPEAGCSSRWKPAALLRKTVMAGISPAVTKRRGIRLLFPSDHGDRFELPRLHQRLGSGDVGVHGAVLVPEGDGLAQRRLGRLQRRRGFERGAEIDALAAARSSMATMPAVLSAISWRRRAAKVAMLT